MSNKSQLLFVIYLNREDEWNLILMHNENIKTFTNIFHQIKLENECLGLWRTTLVAHAGYNMLISLNIRDKENTVRQLETWAEKKEIIIKIEKKKKKSKWGENKDKHKKKCYNYGKLGVSARECIKLKKV